MSTPTVRSLMTTDIVSVRTATPFTEIVELLATRRISAVPVVDVDGRPIGVVSEADLLTKEEFDGGGEPRPMLAGPARRRRWRQAQGTTAGDVMRTPVLTIAPEESVGAAARRLAAAGVRRLFVVDDAGRLAGVLSRRDLLRPYLRGDEQLTADIEAEVVDALWIEPGSVEVSVSEGVVHLTGTLARRSEAGLVVGLARTRPGVVGVIDDLRYEFDDLAAAGSGAV
ncbi:MAG TPA: CBS domain-containing protein [Pseudonocardiaceae bacterium]